MIMSEVEHIHPKTTAEAMNLPVLDESRYKAEYSPIGIEGDEVIAFVDENGNTWKVTHTKNGTFRTPSFSILL